MEEQVRFWRISVDEYFTILSMAIIANLVVLVGTIPIFFMVSITGWQMFFIYLYNLITGKLEQQDAK